MEPQIEDDSQQEIVSEDDMSDFKSPIGDELVSPDSQTSRGESVMHTSRMWSTAALTCKA